MDLSGGGMVVGESCLRFLNQAMALDGIFTDCSCYVCVCVCVRKSNRKEKKERGHFPHACEGIDICLLL